MLAPESNISPHIGKAGARKGAVIKYKLKINYIICHLNMHLNASK